MKKIRNLVKFAFSTPKMAFSILLLGAATYFKTACVIKNSKTRSKFFSKNPKATLKDVILSEMYIEFAEMIFSCCIELFKLNSSNPISMEIFKLLIFDQNISKESEKFFFNFYSNSIQKFYREALTLPKIIFDISVSLFRFCQVEYTQKYFENSFLPPSFYLISFALTTYFIISLLFYKHRRNLNSKRKILKSKRLSFIEKTFQMYKVIKSLEVEKFFIKKMQSFEFGDAKYFCVSEFYRFLMRFLFVSIRCAIIVDTVWNFNILNSDAKIYFDEFGHLSSALLTFRNSISILIEGYFGTPEKFAYFESFNKKKDNDFCFNHNDEDSANCEISDFNDFNNSESLQIDNEEVEINEIDNIRQYTFNNPGLFDFINSNLHRKNILITSKLKKVYKFINDSIKFSKIDQIIYFRTKTSDFFFDEKKRKFISYMPSEQLLFDTSIIDNILYGTDFNEQEAIFRLKNLGALELLEKIISNYDNFLDFQIKNLSFGQKKMVCFCRHVVCDAKIFIFENPTKNINSKLHEGMYSVISRLPKSIIIN